MWSNNERQKQSYIAVGEEDRQAQCSHTDSRAGPGMRDSSQICFSLLAWHFLLAMVPFCAPFHSPMRLGGQVWASSPLEEKLVRVCGTDNWWRQATASVPNCQSVAKAREVSIVLRCFLWGRLLSAQSIAFRVSSGNLNMADHHHLRWVLLNCVREQPAVVVALHTS